MERQNPLQKAEPFFTLPTISYIGCCQDTLRPPRACRSWRRHFFIGLFHGAVSRFTDKPRLASHIPHYQKNSLHLSLRTQNLTSASSRVSSTSQRLLCQLFPWESNRSFWCLLEALEVLELSLLEGSKYTSLCCAVHEVMQWWWMIWCMTWCITTI